MDVCTFRYPRPLSLPHPSLAYLRISRVFPLSFFVSTFALLYFFIWLLPSLRALPSLCSIPPPTSPLFSLFYNSLFCSAFWSSFHNFFFLWHLTIFIFLSSLTFTEGCTSSHVLHYHRDSIGQSGVIVLQLLSLFTSSRPSFSWEKHFRVRK